jgi:hypothetical protein
MLVEQYLTRRDIIKKPESARTRRRTQDSNADRRINAVQLLHQVRHTFAHL